MARTMDHHSGARIGSNEDLLTEILIRLPVTSILRFKSVCKHWRSLLTNNHLTRRYDNNNLSRSLGLFVRTSIPPYDTLARLAGDSGGNIFVPFDVENQSTPPLSSNLDFYFNRSTVRIRQSCNGLLLCYAYHNGDFEYYVFNPTTKQLALIPSVHKTTRIMALAFHPTHCVHYKVVCIRDLQYGDLQYGEDLIQIQVYSSDTRTWKICVKSFCADDHIFRHTVYWNGAVYLTSYYEKTNIYYFKLDSEQLQVIPFPAEMMSYETSIMYFGESRGHLHLIFYTDGEDYMLHVNVYEMPTDHSGWFVKYRLQLDALLPDFPCLISEYETSDDFIIVDLVRGKDEENTFLVLVTPEKIIRYNVHDKSFKELYSKKHYHHESDIVHRYIEALSSF